MSRFARIRRRPDHWASTHERARTRAAERLDGPLGLAEATWLDEHLADCAACTAIATAYEADRLGLRALRDEAPEPPRDLWARTSAAIERESGAAGHGLVSSGSRRRVPVGALSGLAVVAVVVAVSAVSGGLFDGTDGTTALVAPGTPVPEVTSGGGEASPAVIAGAAPTPFDVGAGDVRWFGTADDGELAYNAARVQKVCPMDSAASCATLHSVGEHLALTATPRTIIGSPTQEQAMVVSDDGAGGQQITMLSLPAAATPEPTVPPSAGPLASPEATPAPTPSGAAPSDPGTTAPPATPVATVEPSPSVSPTNEPSAEPTATPTPTLTPAPTVAASLAIASDIAVVGESAAFSADGDWFAFTARPTDGSAGPDVYVWHVGDEMARRLTEDGASYFASWSGSDVVASRSGTDLEGATAQPVTVLIEPETGVERPAGDLWRPVVDPTATRAVGWAGTVSSDTEGSVLTPSDGQLELRAWSAEDGASVAVGATQVIAKTSGGDFDVRWDETGEWFATWVADPSGTDVGRLSLYRVDPATGVLEQADGAPVDVAALHGYSIGEGRLAWATPPGQGGEGSRVQIVAWAPGGVGTVETAPGEGLIVVR